MEDDVDLYRGLVPAPPADPRLVDNVHDMLELLGEDPGRNGLLNTPSRVARSLAFLTSGYTMDPRAVVGDALFEAEYDEMVVVRDIEVYSLCEHHLLPFYGRVHIAYLPSEKIVGLSKLARLAEVYARRLQVQERLTTEIATAIDEILEPKGVGVVMEARHLCMMMRGIEKQESLAVTSCMLGRFRTDARTRGEFLSLIGK
ncbi:MAG TPA: GTP cyclohydrolase I FolE [Dehalococcoidia bacterium]|jgi:GTP cyclohydrolase I|nr:GTP cyclohydrolase I FolE [Dehalococcoidia bacterium]